MRTIYFRALNCGPCCEYEVHRALCLIRCVDRRLTHLTINEVTECVWNFVDDVSVLGIWIFLLTSLTGNKIYFVKIVLVDSTISVLTNVRLRVSA